MRPEKNRSRRRCRGAGGSHWLSGDSEGPIRERMSRSCLPGTTPADSLMAETRTRSIHVQMAAHRSFNPVRGCPRRSQGSSTWSSVGAAESCVEMATTQTSPSDRMSASGVTMTAGRHFGFRDCGSSNSIQTMRPRQSRCAGVSLMTLPGVRGINPILRGGCYPQRPLIWNRPIKMVCSPRYSTKAEGAVAPPPGRGRRRRADSLAPQGLPDLPRTSTDPIPAS